MDPLNFVYTCIARMVLWLNSWQFFGVPFLYWLIGYSVVAITMRFIF